MKLQLRSRARTVSESASSFPRLPRLDLAAGIRTGISSKAALVFGALLSLTACSKSESSSEPAKSVEIAASTNPSTPAFETRSLEAESNEKQQKPALTLEAIRGLSISPSNGVIVESKLDRPGRKTIIYIVDRHSSPGASAAENMDARATQKQLFLTLEEIADQTGAELPIVIENWRSDMNGFHFTPEMLLSIEPNIGTDELAILRDIAQERDPRLKRDLIANNMTRFDSPGTMFFDIAHPDLMRSIGPVSYGDLLRIQAQTEDLIMADRVTHNLNGYTCIVDPSMTLGTAVDRFSNGDRSDLVTACFCDLRAQVEVVISAFREDRAVTAPTAEIKAAFEDSSEGVVVVAGLNHLPISRRLMEEVGVNYIVIAPKELEDRFPKALTKTNFDDVMINPLPDPDPKACEDWSRTPEAREVRIGKVPTTEEEIIKWMMED